MACYEDDDFFGDQDEGEDDFGGRLGAQEDFARQNELKRIGYLEAYDEAKETRLQEGFQVGYKQSFEAASRIGVILGEAVSHVRLKQSTIGTIANGPDTGGETTFIDPSQEAAKHVREFLTNLDGKESERVERSLDIKEKFENLESELKTTLEKWTMKVDFYDFLK